MKDNKNWRVVAKKFEDTTERINDIREWVPENIVVGVDYADKDNPIIKLYNEGEDKPFAQGNVGDYVMNDNGRYDILPKGSEKITEILLRAK